jgi:hypothetical protein
MTHVSAYDIPEVTPEIRRALDRADQALEALNHARESLDPINMQLGAWNPRRIDDAVFVYECLYGAEDGDHEPIPGAEEVAKAARKYWGALRWLRNLEEATRKRLSEEHGIG